MGAVTGDDPRQLVRRGYDALSSRYRADDAEDGWLGGRVPMWWSHADAATYRAWLEAAGLQVSAQDFVPEGAGGHALFWASRPAPVSRQTRSRSGRPAHRTG
jgi:hypothetical protein